MSQDHFDLTAQEFRDDLALHYRKPLLNVPSNCNGCGSPFSLDHALICRKGGLIIQWHNEVRDAVGDLAALVWGRVVSEPVARDASVDGEALIADLGPGEFGNLRLWHYLIFVWSTLTPCLICLIPLLLCWLRLRLRRRGTIVMHVLSVMPPSHHCAFRLMVLLVMRLLAF